MHSLLSRLNTVVSYTITALSVIAIFTVGRSFFAVTEIEDVTIETSNYQVKTYRGWTDADGTESDIDVAFFHFNLNANMTSLFNWNVRQIFLILSVEYPSEEYGNEIVAWDKIVVRGDTSFLTLRNVKPKYYVKGIDGAGLEENRDVSLRLTWNIIPHVGLLPLTTAKHTHRIFQ